MTRPRDGGETQRRLRYAAGAIILCLIIVVVLTDLFGRLFVDADFRVSDLMLGTLIGALLLLVGIDVSKRWPFSGIKGGDEYKDDEADAVSDRAEAKKTVPK